MSYKQHKFHQHFVPKFFLRRFSGNDKEVFVIDRKKNARPYKSKVDKICYQNDLYEDKWEDVIEDFGKYVLDNQIEDYFSELESKTSPLLQYIDKEIGQGQRKIDFTKEQRDILIEFVTTLYLRNPFILNSIVSDYFGVENDPSMEGVMYVINYLFEIGKFGSPKSLVEHSKKIGIFNKEINGNPYDVEYQKLNKMSFVFWHSKEGEFVTSCFPMYIISSDGTHAERIVVPISSEIAIVFFDKLPYPLKQGAVIVIASELARANMQFYYNSYSSDVARFFIAKKPETLSKLIEKPRL